LLHKKNVSHNLTGSRKNLFRFCLRTTTPVYYQIPLYRDRGDETGNNQARPGEMARRLGLIRRYT